MATVDLSHHNELTWLARLICDIRAAAPQSDPLLVGALARDVLLHHAHGVAIERKTTDVDLAIAVAGWPEFTNVRDALLGSDKFVAGDKTAHSLQHREVGRIDLIPFGPVESADGTIRWPPEGHEVLDVLIYAEANATASTVSLPLSQRVRVIALPMLAALKVLAWRDRHSRKPRSDAADLLLILRKYLDAGNAGRLYQEHLSLLEGDDFDFEAAGSWLVGHDIRDQLHEHSARADQIIATLEAAIRPETDRAGRLALASEMMDQVDAERALRLLSALLNGITGQERP